MNKLSDPIICHIFSFCEIATYPKLLQTCSRFHKMRGLLYRAWFIKTMNKTGGHFVNGVHNYEWCLCFLLCGVYGSRDEFEYFCEYYKIGINTIHSNTLHQTTKLAFYNRSVNFPHLAFSHNFIYYNHYLHNAITLHTFNKDVQKLLENKK